MEKSNKITKINEILDILLTNKDLSQEFQINKIKKKWEFIVGDQLSKYTNPVKIQKDVLIIICSHQGWISTIQIYKKNILNNIKKIFNDEIIINDIRFTFKNNN